ncbi:hypothetical protein JCM31826_01810 [Thermaurantimonas aggregans]|uniref:Cytochrome C Planctomycete-type domain-containing protein n=1 Tax=Thermaurantimonas aggregans TaxID=2173829 RepID=A0A401XI59_9FLAO|nr:c-type cytochrome domain-containing protein [Thermaurantimonas aggregans]GCD76699.1 hypothetical protein JCM31826_01810 [Thermaurantimonas aggregans]
MKKYIAITFIALSSAMVLLQCTRRNEEDLKAICFEASILPVIQANCGTAGCHDATTAADGYDLTNYIGIMRAVKPGNGTGSKLVKVMLETRPDKRMPPPPAAPMSQDFIDLVIKWIDKGEGNVVGCASNAACDTSSVSFARDVQPILNDFCVSCHTAGAPSGGVVLNTYNGVKTVADNGKLIGSISHTPGFSAMPPSGIKLDECKLNTIKAWVNSGAPNN